MNTRGRRKLDFSKLKPQLEQGAETAGRIDRNPKKPFFKSGVQLAKTVDAVDHNINVRFMDFEVRGPVKGEIKLEARPDGKVELADFYPLGHKETDVTAKGRGGVASNAFQQVVNALRQENLQRAASDQYKEIVVRNYTNRGIDFYYNMGFRFREARVGGRTIQEMYYPIQRKHYWGARPKA